MAHRLASLIVVLILAAGCAGSRTGPSESKPVPPDPKSVVDDPSMPVIRDEKTSETPDTTRGGGIHTIYAYPERPKERRSVYAESRIPVWLWIRGGGTFWLKGHDVISQSGAWYVVNGEDQYWTHLYFEPYLKKRKSGDCYWPFTVVDEDGCSGWSDPLLLKVLPEDDEDEKPIDQTGAGSLVWVYKGSTLHRETIAKFNGTLEANTSQAKHYFYYNGKLQATTSYELNGSSPSNKSDLSFDWTLSGVSTGAMDDRSELGGLSNSSLVSDLKMTENGQPVAIGKNNGIALGLGTGFKSQDRRTITFTAPKPESGGQRITISWMITGSTIATYTWEAAKP